MCLHVCRCVCEFIFVFYIYIYIYIYRLDRESERGDGNKKGRAGRNEEREERKDYFCIFYIIMWNGDSGVLREGQISYHHPLGVHLHPLVCQRSKAWGCPSRAAWWAWSPCNCLHSMCQVPQWHRRMPTNTN